MNTFTICQHGQPTLCRSLASALDAMCTAIWIEGPCTIWELTANTARKVWQGTPEDARAGRGYVTEEPAPEIPPCKYPVGTVLRHRDGRAHNRFAVIGTQLVWDYVLQTNDGTVVNRHGPYVDQYFTDAPPDHYPVGSEHVVDLGLLGRQTVTVTNREGERVTVVVGSMQCTTTVSGFDKAVVK